MKLLKRFPCFAALIFIFLMNRVIPRVVGNLLLVLKTGYVCSHAVSCIHAEPNDSATSLTALLRLCAPQSTSECWNTVWSRAVRQWLCHDAASRCLFSGFYACLVGLLWCI